MVKAVKILTCPITHVITEEDQDQDKYRQHKSPLILTCKQEPAALNLYFIFETFFIFAAAG